MKTSKAFLAIISILSVICGGCVIFRADNKPVGLVYHCTFDSKEAIEEPMVGPKGEFIGGDFVDGVKDKALLVAANSCSAIVPMEAGMLGQKGCFELWGKFTPPRDVITTGHHPCFFTFGVLGVEPRFCIEWNGNNGLGGGGLNAMIEHLRACTSNFRPSPRYKTIMGDKEQDWNHYALVWNKDGIKELSKDGEPLIKAVIFFNGKVVASTSFPEAPKWGLSPAITAVPTFLCFPFHKDVENRSSVNYAIDEFRFWNYDKVDFDL